MELNPQLFDRVLDSLQSQLPQGCVIAGLPSGRGAIAMRTGRELAVERTGTSPQLSLFYVIKTRNRDGVTAQSLVLPVTWLLEMMVKWSCWYNIPWLKSDVQGARVRHEVAKSTVRFTLESASGAPIVVFPPITVHADEMRAPRPLWRRAR